MSIQFAYREGNPFMDMAFDYARTRIEGVSVAHNPEEINPEAIVVTDRTFANSPELTQAKSSLNAYNFIRRINVETYIDIANQIATAGGEAFYLRARINDHSRDPRLSDMLEEAGWKQIRGYHEYLGYPFEISNMHDEHCLGRMLDEARPDWDNPVGVKDFTPDNAIIGIDHHAVTYAKGPGSLRFKERQVVLLCPCCVHQDVTGESGDGYGPKNENLYMDTFSRYNFFKPEFDTDALTPVFEELVEALRQRQS